jgi:hypothetical protein
VSNITSKPFGETHKRRGVTDRTAALYSPCQSFRLSSTRASPHGGHRGAECRLLRSQCFGPSPEHLIFDHRSGSAPASPSATFAAREAAALIHVKLRLFEAVVLRSVHAESGDCAAPVLERTIVQQPAHRRPSWNAATFHLAVVTAAPSPPRRHDAASCRTRAVVRFDAGDVTIFKDQPYPRRAICACG